MNIILIIRKRNSAFLEEFCLIFTEDVHKLHIMYYINQSAGILLHMIMAVKDYMDSFNKQILTWFYIHDKQDKLCLHFLTHTR